MNDIVPASSLSQQVEYARLITDGSTILPDAYRGKPANALIAIGLGQAMGLTPAEALYRIDVIQGKPTASAELIASNVRKAGHKLRVRVDEANTSVTATIIRADDPDYEHTVTRDMAWAQKMGLHTKDNYRKQPLTMLQWRAITAVARLACSEALYGVAYTPDEMYDLGERPAPVTAPAAPVEAQSAVARLAAAAQPTPAPEPPAAPAPPADEVNWYAELDAAGGDFDAIKAIYGRATRLGADPDILADIKAAGDAALAQTDTEPIPGELIQEGA